MKAAPKESAKSASSVSTSQAVNLSQKKTAAETKTRVTRAQAKQAIAQSQNKESVSEVQAKPAKIVPQTNSYYKRTRLGSKFKQSDDQEVHETKFNV